MIQIMFYLKILFWSFIHTIGIGTLWSIKKNEYFKFELEKMK